MDSIESCRLRIHARLYHQRKTDKPAAISTYWEKADSADQSYLRRLAAVVASWIAYGPPGRIPTVEELQLLTKFIHKMDGGLLPSRLSDVLCEMKRRLQSLPRPADEAWNEAEKRLQRNYRKLHRRCRQSDADTAAVAADHDLVDEDVQEEALQVREADDAGSPCTSAQSDQGLVLFRKMNEWGFLDGEQKLERLQQAEVVSRRSRKNLSQEELADVLNTAAACLAAPRRHARLQDVGATYEAEVRAAPDSQDPTVDLQKRIRSLLLQALHVWQMNQFDCQAIEHVLDCVQQKISKFENKVGEIQGAAAGKAWLKIKQMVDELLLPVETPSNPPHAKSKRKAHAEAGPKVNVRLERQSGIQNISWVVQKAAWKCERSKRRGGIRTSKSRLFPISKFLEEGLGEEAAVEAALREAKAFREELVRQGKLKPPMPKGPSSTVRGVSFYKALQKWAVRLYHPVEKKGVHIGYFDAKEEAEAKAREMARQYGIRAEYEVRPAKRSRAEVKAELETAWELKTTRHSLSDAALDRENSFTAYDTTPCAPEYQRWISTYWEKADSADQSYLRRLAAVVASWIAYGPPGRIPTVEEFQLLTKFIHKMDGGLLPSRLSDVLCEMKRRLQSLPRPADEAWNEAEKRLQENYRKLHRRCRQSEVYTVVVAADHDIVDEDVQEEALQVREADDAGSPCTSAQSDQGLVLFRKMNEWGFLDSEQKLERLQQAEVVSRRSRKNLSQEELADVLNTAAACLAAPRRHARLQDVGATYEAEVRAAPDSQDPTVDLQKRIRSLLLHALRMWQMNQFDCEAIEHVLDCVQRKITKFENKVGEIQCAAAGKAWLKIKQMIDELLLRAEARSKPHAKAPKFRVILERQSGIQNITWNEKKAGWQCQLGSNKKQGFVRKARLFNASKFLEQGLGEEAAVEAALQEAKAYRKELVRQGKLKPPKPKNPRSTVRGVQFDNSRKKWQVQFFHPVQKKKRVFGGYFLAQEQAEAKARELARQLGVRPEYEVRPAKRGRAESKLGTENNQVPFAQCMVKEELGESHELVRSLRWLYIGEVGSGTSAHADPLASHGWMWLAAGRKDWRFVNWKAKGARQRCEAVPEGAPKDLFESSSCPELAAWLQKNEATHEAWFGELSTGELMFVPSAILHSVRNRGTRSSIAVSHNFVDSTCVDAVLECLQQVGSCLYRGLGLRFRGAGSPALLRPSRGLNGYSNGSLSSPTFPKP
ncbi:unnamed protein product [Symbiodinium microadriaticum]|nr:unnamed protein product [Symbiodinium microadriaticum]